jgi:CHASE1-domain containing sensor protein
MFVLHCFAIQWHLPGFLVVSPINLQLANDRSWPIAAIGEGRLSTHSSRSRFVQRFALKVAEARYAEDIAMATALATVAAGSRDRTSNTQATMIENA